MSISNLYANPFDSGEGISEENSLGQHGKGNILGILRLPLSLALRAIFGVAQDDNLALYHKSRMTFPIKVCAVCSEEFELKPDKPGFANRCPACSDPETAEPATKSRMDADERKNANDANEARRQAMRELLYRKDS
jgi:hypothetical protein